MVWCHSENHLSEVKPMYEKWLYDRATKLFHQKVKKFSQELNIEVDKIIVKNLKNRWGSVTREGVINLNLHLLKAPINIIDYIVVHELCHILVRGHSHHFWALVRQIIPNYKKSIAWLELNSSSLIE